MNNSSQPSPKPSEPLETPTVDRPQSTREYIPSPVQAVRWVGDVDGYLVLLDQTRLPLEKREIQCRSVEHVWDAIRRLCVRGAPAIGLSAAYGVCLGLQQITSRSPDEFLAHVDRFVDYLSTSRPTAVNLFWALARMKRVAHALRDVNDTRQLRERLLAEAHAIYEEDRSMCRAIGRHGAPLVRSFQAVLTHCNTGSLATAEYGTALSVIYTAHDQGHTLHVYVDETRPLWQGARLTAWELAQRGIPTTVICDSMAGWLMHTGRVQAVLVGADRIAANGDTANKIGTYSLAVLARAHQLPFYVAAPRSTFDLTLTTGEKIPIEERAPDEIVAPFGCRIAPDDIDVYNPAFDVTPAELITAIITERGIIQPVNADQIKRLLQNTNQ